MTEKAAQPILPLRTALLRCYVSIGLRMITMNENCTDWQMHEHTTTHGLLYVKGKHTPNLAP